MIRNRLLAEELRLARMKARQEEEARLQQSSQMQVEPDSIEDSEQNVQNSTEQLNQPEERSQVPNQQEPPNYWAEDEDQDFDNLVMDQL